MSKYKEHNKPFDQEINPKLLSEKIDMSDLKRHLILTHGTLKRAGQVAGFSDAKRIHQIISHYKIPKGPSIIFRLSRAWNIDVVVLTQLFERSRDCPPIVSADKIKEELSPVNQRGDALIRGEDDKS